MKYYKVIKENFLWEVGAIIGYEGSGYRPIDSIFKESEYDETEYISEKIVENYPEYFQRVYKVDLATRVLYETKDKAIELINKQFKN